MPNARYSISTIYKGQQVDSLLEGRWAAFFDLLGWDWEPQPETAFGVWRPDFRITVPANEGDARILYVEVKPRDHIEEAWERIDHSSYAGAALIVTDKPFEHAGSYAIGEFRQERESHYAHIVDGHEHYQELNNHWNSIENSIRPRPGKARQGERPPELFRIELPAEQRGTRRSWMLAGSDLRGGSPQQQPQRGENELPDRGDTGTPLPVPGPEMGRTRKWVLPALGGLAAVGVASAALILFLLGQDDQPEAPLLPAAVSTEQSVVDRNCGDFATWPEAQAFYEEAGGPEADPHSLDPDQDGVACERLRGAEAATPEEPVEDRDCDDFTTWDAAQAFYEQAGGPEADPHRLDPDEDGVACEALREGDGQ